MSAHPDVLVCGAGAWGLASAWRSAREGAAVTIVDDGQPPAAHVAAGMLGARAEADAQDLGLLDLLSEALRRWSEFSSAVGADAGQLVGDRYPGALLAAGRPEHIERIRRAGEVLAGWGEPSEWLTGSGLRTLEPALAPALAGGLLLPEEGQVDPRRLMAALRDACERLGVATLVGRASGIERDGDRVAGALRLEDGTRIAGGVIVVAAGSGASRLAPGPRVRPVKGQILRLRARGAPPLERTVRTPEVYIVPREDGEIVVGATMEERSDRLVTAGAVLDLLEEATRLCPELAEAELAEAAAGLRPATDDGRPVIGRSDPEGPIWAVGGLRHGILLAPLAADLVWSEIADPAGSHPVARALATQREEHESLASS